MKKNTQLTPVLQVHWIGKITRALCLAQATEH
jgi:hypothetical protein